MSDAVAALLAKRKAIEDDPKNSNPPGSFWIYTAPARRKIDAINLEIARLTTEERKARGESINESGYSGRQTNRR